MIWRGGYIVEHDSVGNRLAPPSPEPSPPPSAPPGAIDPAQDAALAEEMARTAQGSHNKNKPHNVKQLLQQSNTGFIHDSGHGYAQRDEAQNVVDYGLILQDQRLKALNWRGMMVGKENASLIFFNACEVGLAESSAGFVDGWSKALTDTGSRGFISSLWELGDQGVAKSSQRFYTEIDRLMLLMFTVVTWG
ncbi:MAG: CHAT domain-containing protein [Candidatus Azotimanducaceae bacterium]